MAVELGNVDFAVRVIAQTVVDNEKYFGELDSVVGDGDFGYSLARGFEMVLRDWESYDRTDAAVFLQKVAMVITSRIGGTSGPIWGTAFLRSAMVARKHDHLGADVVVEMLDSAIEGIKARGGAEIGDKTLLDALAPVRDRVAELGAQGEPPQVVLDAVASTARSAADATSALQARRGRAAYTGERSIGSPDAGAVAVAVLAESLAAHWPERTTVTP